MEKIILQLLYDFDYYTLKKKLRLLKSYYL